MLFPERVKCFIRLGERLKSLEEDELSELCQAAQNGNSWFTQETVSDAIKAITYFLEEGVLMNWTSNYKLESIAPKKIGVIAAGNIPLVGFHDILSVLISGHILMLKPSSDDTILIKYIQEELIAIDPRMKACFLIADRLNEADAYIATGSDNSAKYFQYYFKDKPNIIRANRSSVALLTGKESKEELIELGKDIFKYYGLGCRNVSKLFVPQSYEFDQLFDALQEYESVGDHHKYRNNYDYNKSIYLVNGEKHLDNGFLLVRESTDMVSPISVLYYETYVDLEEVEDRLNKYENKIQCKVGDGYIPFGQGQYPKVGDYADGVDVLEFLQHL